MLIIEQTRPAIAIPRPPWPGFLFICFTAMEEVMMPAMLHGKPRTGYRELNDPPPPAPPNVPQLSRLADKPITTRERLRAHQEEAQCASCHRKIDPIGFGLENFDAAGKWRTTEAHRIKTRRSWRTTRTWKIDASGAFYNSPASEATFRRKASLSLDLRQLS